MCGIAAIFSKEQRLHRPELEAALRSMRHRGPDGEGVWVSRDEKVALGSVRLAVMDPQGGEQPLRNEDASIHAVVNGEFYDFERLRADLEARGHVFTTRSDSELLLHLYEEHGLECLRHLRGEFAFILWDERLQRFFAARDRFGIKPLHFAEKGGAWLLASEVKSLLCMGLESRWDVESLEQALVHQYLREGRTLFAGVRSLRPAHALVMEKGSVREFEYWRPSFETDENITAEAVRAALEEAVRLRMRCDVPVVCTLSGGLDSSAVAALSGVRDGFCVRFDTPEHDEGPLVLADKAQNMRVHEVRVSRRDQVTHLEAAACQSEGLAINGQLVGKFLLSRAIRDAGFKVVLAGEGADEAFLGYAHLQQDFTGAAAASAVLQRCVMLPATDEVSEASSLPTFLQAKMATGRHLTALMKQVPDARRVLEGTLMQTGVSASPHPVRQNAWLWTRLALGGYILRTLGDGAEMAHSVEARLPFLDHFLFEMAVRIPPRALISAENTKLLLREALRGVLPENVRTRPKHPFLAPPLDLLDAVTRDFVHDTLHSADLPLLDAARLRRWLAELFEAPVALRCRLDPVLMQLLTAALLQKNYRMT